MRTQLTTNLSNMEKTPIYATFALNKEYILEVAQTRVFKGFYDAWRFL